MFIDKIYSNSKIFIQNWNILIRFQILLCCVCNFLFEYKYFFMFFDKFLF